MNLKMFKQINGEKLVLLFFGSKWVKKRRSKIFLEIDVAC